jgi:hypothetical protein
METIALTMKEQKRIEVIQRDYFMQKRKLGH